MTAGCAPPKVMKSKQGDGTVQRGPGPGPWDDTKNPTDGMQWMPTLLLGMTRAGPGIVAMQMNSRPTKCNAVMAPRITTLLDDMRTTNLSHTFQLLRSDKGLFVGLAQLPQLQLQNPRGPGYTLRLALVECFSAGWTCEVTTNADDSKTTPFDTAALLCDCSTCPSSGSAMD